MLKPNFNPLFYNQLVYDVDFGGSKPPVRIARTTAAPRTPEAKDKESLTAAQVNAAKRSMKSAQENLLRRTDNELKDKDKVTYRNLRVKIRSYYSGSATKVHRHMTREDLARVQEAAVKKELELGKRIDAVRELIEHKNLGKKEIQKITQKKIKQYATLWGKNKQWRKKMDLNQVVYVASAYLMKWESVNSKAIDRIIDVDVAKKIYSEIRSKQSKIFDDLRAIEGDMLSVYETWAQKDGNPRDIYVRSDWDTKYEKSMPSMIKKGLKVYSYTKTSRGKGALIGGAIGSVVPVAGTVIGAGIGALVGKDSKHMHYPSEGDIEYYLKWARKQAKKGKFAPLPKISRGDRGRVSAKITAAINPEKLRRTIDFQNRAVDLQKRLNKASKSGMKFGTVNVHPDKNEAKIEVIHKGKKIGFVEMGPDGKIYVAAKKKKVEVPSKKETDIIAAMEELALNPKVKELKVAKTGGKATLRIVGDNLPTTSTASIDLRAGSIKLARLGMSRTDVKLASNLLSVDANIKKVLRDSLDEYVKSYPKIGPKMKSKITAKFIEELQQKVYPKGAGKRPQLIIRGKADVITGSFAENKKIAEKRTKSAHKALKTKNPRLDQIYDVKEEPIVAGPNGKPVGSEAEGWRKTLKAWNDDPKIKEKFTLAEMKKLKKRIKNPKAGAQAKFVQNFEDQRGADMLILPPKSENQGYDIVVGGGTATTGTASSVPTS